MARNIFQDAIVAEKPAVMAQERIVVYVPTGSKSIKGALKVGDNINVVDGTISIPIASGTEAGIIKFNEDLFTLDNNTADIKFNNAHFTISDKTVNAKLAGGTTTNATYGMIKLDDVDARNTYYAGRYQALLLNSNGRLAIHKASYSGAGAIQISQQFKWGYTSSSHAYSNDVVMLNLVKIVPSSEDIQRKVLGGVYYTDYQGIGYTNLTNGDDTEYIYLKPAGAGKLGGIMFPKDFTSFNGLKIDPDGKLIMEAASKTKIGTVKLGDVIASSSNGITVNVGYGLKKENDAIRVDSNYYYDKTAIDRKFADIDLEDLEAIKLVIPTQASADNQLADKDFVNSSINAVAAYYITSNSSGDAFSTKAALTSATVFYSGGEVRTPTRNDYALVLSDESHYNSATRYSYQNGQWEYQYTLNTSSFTAAQLAALNSGVTSDLLDSFAKSTDVYDKDTVDQNITDAIEGAYGIIEEVSFVGSLSEDTITYEFDNMPEGFELENNKLYIGDFNLALTTFTGTIENDTKLVIQNGTDSIRILCKKNDSINVDSTVGDLCQLQSYDLVTGFTYRVIFQCRIIGGATYIYVYGIVDESASAMHGEELHSKIVNGTLRPDTVITCMSSYEHDGYEYMKGNSYLIHGEYDDGELILSAEVCGVGEIYVDTKIGDIDTILTTLNSGGGV